ncbi:DUF3237 domain-containing protein [Altererythrobacter sp. Root672]|uniref:DUF3237 domain-containing protein n=1 Tax=Altererythrobacter sp. Root672 TaxID=1736584 RepID=UPI0009E7617B|nr:DUF3237 domain-containing protein [Altererythrobacter sp. Root672]
MINVARSGTWAIGMSALLASTAALPQDVPQPPRLEFAFEEIVTLGQAIPVGETPLGKRNIVPITGGTFSGPGIEGTIIAGGWDWQLTRSDGCTEIEADYMIRTNDGVVINVINVGALCPPEAGARTPAKTQPRFEAPKGKYDWLNRSAFIGTLDLAPGTTGPAVRIRIYKAV